MNQEQADRLSVLLRDAEKALQEAGDLTDENSSLEWAVADAYDQCSDALIALRQQCEREVLEYTRD